MPKPITYKEKEVRVMSRMLRSKNPDLLIPEVMNERIRKTTDFWGERCDVTNALDRVTAFVTHRCNLSCKYCRGPHVTFKKRDSLRKKKMLRNDLSVDSFRRLLEEAKESGRIKHIHFTGGEPTLNKNLPVLIEMSTGQGILSSITTNGTANPEVYRNLIKKGLTEIRISIDSHSGERFDSIAGVRGTFGKVVDSIQEIVRLRDEENADVFLVLNTCVGEINLDELEKTLAFLISLNPNDIKFLVIAQDKEFVIDYKAESFINKLRKSLKRYPDEQFPLLRTKIENLFNPYATGLKDKKSQAIMRHCFIPMTERTIDGSNYYPCSIYLRYYGKPIGSLTDSFKEQQFKVMEFVRKHDCRKDSICSRHCTNCCKVFNVRTNEALNVDSDRVIEIENDITEKEIATLVRKTRSLIETSQPSNRPFLIIKPHGQQWRNEIVTFLERNGIEIESITEIKDWPECAKFLYAWPLTKKEMKFTLEMDRAFTRIEPGFAELLQFKKDPNIDQLAQMKLDIRRLFPTKRFLLNISNRKRWIRLSAVHTPDAEDVKRENTILSKFLD